MDVCLCVSMYLFISTSLTAIKVLSMNTDKQKQTAIFEAYVKEDYIAICISVRAINAIKSLRELHVAYISTNLGIHHETHCLTNCLAIVNIVIAIKVEDIWCICENCRHPYLQYVQIKWGTSNCMQKITAFWITYQSIFSTSFFVMLVAGSLLSRNINQSRKFISFYVMGSTMSKENLKRINNRSSANFKI